MRLDTNDRQAILEERNTEKRMRKLTMLLTKELEVVELGHKIQSDIQREMEKNQREFYLRQQLRAIQEELGETDPQLAEANELRKKIDDAKMPEDVKKAADRELERLSSVPTGEPRVQRDPHYLDWLVQLPWETRRPIRSTSRKARAILDKDHYDLEKVKDRIIEYLAVGKLKNKLTGPILCFVGPPGVGKTSLGQSIAKAMGRKFVRLSVGGVRDEAEIRGHRRTYIGAMPGTIVRALRDAGTNNPVMMIDEIDKVGGDYRGDPQSALLEVLDPEQNNSFRDHYLDLPLRSLASALHLHGQPARDDPPAAARPHGDHLALGLHRDGETPDRQALPGQKQHKANGLQGNAGRRSATRRSARSSPTTPARPAYATSNARSARSSAKSRARSPKNRSTRRAIKPENARRLPRRSRASTTKSKKRVASVGVATGMA